MYSSPGMPKPGVAPRPTLRNTAPKFACRSANGKSVPSSLPVSSFTAKFFDHGHFSPRHFGRFAKADDAVCGKTARQVAFFKQRHTVPAFREFARTGETRGARANDRHFLACGFPWLEQVCSPGINEVPSHVAAAPDGDGLVLRAKNTSAFAQFLHRAYARAGAPSKLDSRWCARSLARFSVASFLMNLGYVNVCGAGVRTGSVVAHQTSCRFDSGCVACSVAAEVRASRIRTRRSVLNIRQRILLIANRNNKMHHTR